MQTTFNLMIPRLSKHSDILQKHTNTLYLKLSNYTFNFEEFENIELTSHFLTSTYNTDTVTITSPDIHNKTQIQNSSQKYIVSNSSLLANCNINLEPTFSAESVLVTLRKLTSYINQLLAKVYGFECLPATNIVGYNSTTELRNNILLDKNKYCSFSLYNGHSTNFKNVIRNIITHPTDYNEFYFRTEFKYSRLYKKEKTDCDLFNTSHVYPQIFNPLTHDIVLAVVNQYMVNFRLSKDEVITEIFRILSIASNEILLSLYYLGFIDNIKSSSAMVSALLHLNPTMVYDSNVIQKLNDLVDSSINNIFKIYINRPYSLALRTINSTTSNLPTAMTMNFGNQYSQINSPSMLEYERISDLIAFTGDRPLYKSIMLLMTCQTMFIGIVNSNIGSKHISKLGFDISNLYLYNPDLVALNEKLTKLNMQSNIILQLPLPETTGSSRSFDKILNFDSNTFVFQMAYILQSISNNYKYLVQDFDSTLLAYRTELMSNYYGQFTKPVWDKALLMNKNNELLRSEYKLEYM